MLFCVLDIYLQKSEIAKRHYFTQVMAFYYYSYNIQDHSPQDKNTSVSKYPSPGELHIHHFG